MRCIFIILIKRKSVNGNLSIILKMTQFIHSISLADFYNIVVETPYLLLAILYRILIIQLLIIYISFCFSTFLNKPMLPYYKKCLKILGFLLLLRFSFLSSLLISISTDPGVFIEFYTEELSFITASICSNSINLDFLTEGIRFILSSKVIHCDNIPYTNTIQLDKGVVKLVEMFDYLPTSSPLKDYIQGNCAHLLAPLKGATSIAVEKASVNYLCTLPETISLTDSHPKGLQIYKNKAGVYVFFNPNFANVSQCGSCIDYVNRMYGHYADLKHLVLPFYNEVLEHGGFSSYKFTPLDTTINYLAEYKELMNDSISLQEEFILKSFTQQEVRSLEQAYSTFAKPIHYNNSPINISHGRWYPEYYLKVEGNLVTWTTVKGEEHTASSIKKAADMLNVSPTTVSRYANVTGPKSLLSSPVYGDVNVNVEGVLDVFSPRLTKEYLDINMDLSDLMPNHLYLYDEDMNPLDVGPFTSLSEGMKQLDMKYHKFYYKYVNKLFTIFVPSLGISVFFVVNRVNLTKPCIVTNLTDGSVMTYSSLQTVYKKWEPTESLTEFLHTYVVKGKSFVFKDKAYTIKIK